MNLENWLDAKDKILSPSRLREEAENGLCQFPAPAGCCSLSLLTVRTGETCFFVQDRHPSGYFSRFRCTGTWDTVHEVDLLMLVELLPQEGHSSVLFSIGFKGGL